MNLLQARVHGSVAIAHIDTARKPRAAGKAQTVPLKLEKANLNVGGGLDMRDRHHTSYVKVKAEDNVEKGDRYGA